MKERSEQQNDVEVTTPSGVEEASITEEGDVTVETTDAEDLEDEDEDEDEDPQVAELERLKNENRELNARVLRVHADLENFRKRAAREKQESIKYANKQIFLNILDVLDNFERALSSAEDPKDNFVVGVAMIHKQLIDTMTQNGVEEIDAKGKAFDPYLHEAFAKEETDEFEDNTVMDVFQKGFLFHGSLLRPAKVKVAAAPAEQPETETEEETESEG